MLSPTRPESPVSFEVYKPENTIQVYLITPGKSMKSVILSPKQKISIFDKVLASDNQMMFIFNGQVLGKHNSLSFYGIDNNDVIVSLLDDNTHENQRNKWVMASRDKDFFAEKMRFAINPMTRGEYARLRDLSMMNVERKRRGFVNLCSLYKEHYPTGKQDQIPNSVISDEKKDGPSLEPLPIFWS